MIDGVALLLATTYGLLPAGHWEDERGKNLLDGGTHFYDTYETADGKYISIGSIEPKFYALLLKYTGLGGPDFEAKMDRKRWPELKEKVAAVFKTKTRAEWCQIMEGTDTCFAPVLSLDEAVQHSHNVARNTFVEVQGVTQPAPAPRFSRTRAEIQGPPPTPFEDSESVLQDWGFAANEIEALKSSDAI
jgi:alpha-methylacyl-CoA racemase